MSADGQGKGKKCRHWSNVQRKQNKICKNKFLLLWMAPGRETSKHVNLMADQVWSPDLTLLLCIIQADWTTTVQLYTAVYHPSWIEYYNFCVLSQRIEIHCDASVLNTRPLWDYTIVCLKVCVCVYVCVCMCVCVCVCACTYLWELMFSLFVLYLNISLPIFSHKSHW